MVDGRVRGHLTTSVLISGVFIMCVLNALSSSQLVPDCMILAGWLGVLSHVKWRLNGTGCRIAAKIWKVRQSKLTAGQESGQKFELC